MSVDIVSLVYAADATQLSEAEKAFDRLTAAVVRNDAAERKRLTATERAGITTRRAADETVRATRAATDHARAQGAVERATRDADRTAQQSLAFRMRMNAQAVREATTAAKAQAAAQVAADREAERSAQQLLQFRVRMAKQRAAEEARAAKETEAAQLAADRAAERSAQQLLAFRMRMAKQRAAEEVKAAREQAAAVSSLEARIDALKGSIDPTYAAQKRLNAEMQEAAALYKMGAISASDYAKAVGVLDQRMDAAARGQASMGGLHAAGAKGARLQAHEVANLGSQFADIGVSLASGQALWLVAIQQGAQIGGIYGSAAARGATLTGILGQLGAAVGRVASRFGPLLIVTAAAAAAMALFHREVGKDQDAKKLIASLNLTEEQLKRVKDETITFGDTMKATFQVLGRYIMDSPIGDAIDQIRENLSKWLDEFASNSVKEVAVIVGTFTGAFAGIKAVWQNFPAVMGDIGTTAANAFLKAIEGMLNRAIDQLNKFMTNAHNLARTGAFGPVAMAGAWAVKSTPQIGNVTINPLENRNRGAASDVGAAARQGFQSGYEGTIGLASRTLDRIRDQREKNFLDRVREKAGDANKTPKGPGTPRDMTDERLAQLAAEEARVRQDHLQAMLAVTRDFRARAELERQILALAVMEKQAGYDKVIATTKDEITAKKITAARGQELIQAYERLKAQVGLTGVVQQIAINEAEIRTATQAELDLRRTQQQGALDIQKAQADLLRSEFARNVAGVAILKAEQAMARDAIEQQLLKADQLGLTAEQVAILKVQLDAMKQVHAAEVQIAERSTTLADALKDARDSVRDFKDAFRSQDWSRLFDSFVSAIEAVKASFSQFGLTGGLATAGGMVGSLIGGRTGRAVGKAAGYIGGGAFLGSQLMGAATTGLLGNGAMAGMGMALAGALPYIGIIAGLASLAKAFQKPSNKGAGYDLITGAISGKSRDDETTAAVTQAGDAILQAQELLKGYGLTLNETIRGLVIGTRDPSQIYTSSGKTLTSAKGNPQAAVEAALAAVLDGADFVSEAQKKLVTDMRAAGKGFDDIATALQGFAAAQDLLKGVQDEILRLTDPRAYDLQSVRRVGEEQLKAAKAAYDAGYLTADQLNELNAALARLNGLQIDEVMSRYGGDVIANLTDQLRTAYESERAALEEQAAAYRQFVDSLKGYADQIRGAITSTLSPGQQLGAASRRFQNIASLAAQGDKGALGQFQGAAEAFRQASAQFSPDAATNRRNLAAIQTATKDALAAAENQVDFAEQQLAVLEGQVAPFLNDIRTNTLNTVQALAALKAASAAKAGGGDPIQAAVVALAAQGPTAGASDPFNAAAYLAANKDLRKAGFTEEQALQHYLGTGQYEIAAGLRNRGYASGTNSASPGWHWVGEEGPELMRFRGGEQVVPNHQLRGGNDNGRTEALIERQNTLIAEGNRQMKKLTDLMVRVTRDGDSLVTVAA